MSSAQPVVRRNLPWLLAVLSMIGPFSIDAVFPAFPQIGERYDVDATALQQLLSVYLVTYAAMSLFHGAISDAVGRKPVIIAGLMVYCLASMGAALSTSFAALLFCRGLQGLSAGAGLVVGRAVIRDTFEGVQAQRLMSQVMMIFGVAPVIAPMVGAQLLPLGGWQAIFWFLAAFSLLLVGVLVMWLDETHPVARRTRFAPKPLLASYVVFGRDRPFWPLLLASSVNFAGLFLYVASAPQIILDLMQLSPDGFPWLFGPVVVGFIGGAWLSGRMAERRSVAFTVRVGYVLMLLACALHVTLGLLWDEPRLPWSMLPLLVQAIGVQLVFPTLTLLLLDRFPRQRGGISSVQAFASLLLSSVIAGVLSPLLSRSMLHLALGATTLTVLGFIGWRWYRRITRGRADSEPCQPASAAELQSEIAEPR